VPIFFPDADLAKTPAIAKYMKACAERPAFAKAFGDGHAQLVQKKADAWLSAGGGAGGNDMMKKLFG
jgi:hypothetical protein